MSQRYFRNPAALSPVRLQAPSPSVARAKLPDLYPHTPCPENDMPSKTRQEPQCAYPDDSIPVGCVGTAPTAAPKDGVETLSLDPTCPRSRAP